MSKLEKIVDELSTLTVMEAAELSKLLEEKWGVSAAAPVAVAAAAAGPAAPAAEGVLRCSSAYDKVKSSKSSAN
jgi:large subunit ribosomal protein L7/L12